MKAQKMKAQKLIRAAAVIASLAAGCWLSAYADMSFGGQTHYVSAAAAAGGDGTAEAPYRTIQEALDVADHGDTISVGAGVYDEGTRATDDACAARVRIDKRVRIVGAGRDRVFVEGCAAAGADGLGDGAVRGFYCSADSHGARIEGLTVRGGRTGLSGVGGGIWCAGGNAVTNYLIDCTISDCISGGAGAAAYGGVLVRTLVENSTSVTPNAGALAKTLGAYNCVFTACGRNGGLYKHDLNCPVVGKGAFGPFVNCTFSANAGYGAQKVELGELSKVVFRNCIFFAHITVGVEAYADCEYCATGIAGQLASNKHNFGGGDRTADLPSPYQLVSPLTDWRLRDGSVLVDAGSDDALALIPAEFRDKDFYGQQRHQGTAVDIGAAEGAVVCASGFVTFPRNVASSTNICVNGRRIVKPGVYQGDPDKYDWIYLSAAEFPARLKLTCDPGAGQELFGLKTGMTDRRNIDMYRFPDADGKSFSIVLPPAGTTLEQTLVYASGIKWTDPENGVDDADHGSENAPYRTLQYAVDQSEVQGVVLAKKGVYAEGGTLGRADSDDVCTTSNRLTIAKALRVVSVEGAEKTIIKGKRSSVDMAHDGCGPDAMRCVQFVGNVHSCLQGFTITGGATDCDPTARFAAAGKPNPDDRNRGNFGGAGVLCGVYVNWHQFGQVLDCVISNNVAYFGAAAYNGWFQRCVIAENRTIATSCDPSILRISGVIFGSSVDSCLLYGNRANTYLYGQGCRMTCCTVRETAQSPFEVNAWRANCVAADSPAWDYAEGENVHSCVVWPTLYSYWHNNGNTCILANALTSPARGEYRPRPGSEALTAGSTAVASDAKSYVFWKYYTDGIDGAPLFANGSSTCVAGCYGLAYRPVERYVNAVSGSDSEDGLTASTAKKSLASVLSDAMAGDVVHAAPGTYAEKSSVHEGSIAGSVSDTKIETRAVVPDYVTLVADGTPTETIIKGNRDTVTPTYAGSGILKLGPAAIRCVVLGDHSCLKGFRLVDGGTSYYDDYTQNDNTVGGAVLAKDSSRVEDCTIVDCASFCFNAFQGTYVRCVFDHDWAHGAGGAGGRINVYNCYIDRCCDAPLSSVYVVRNTTIGPNCFLWGEPIWKLGTLISFRYPDTAEMANNLILASSKSGSLRYKNAINNVASTLAESIVYEDDGSCSGNVTYAPEQLPIDATGRPLAGNKAIDAGDNAALVAGCSADLDLASGQRIYNGTVDAGAYEYDWRGDYSAVLGKKGRVAVVEASPDLVMNGSELILHDGILSCAWDAGKGDRSRAACFQVKGGGQLTVEVAGGVTRTFDAADGFVRLPIAPATADKVTFRYEKEGAAGTEAGVAFSRFEDMIGMVVILR